ncbi:O-acetylhomoserine aminocarboxypropyltransferase [Azospirillum thiophilum]|uniref:O-acetylhomoserine aminocarboxypropyltransferase n=1 Tax=Azospirillum thiophilum TaxID=528244 RepID=A0AAC8VV61_9PROT|nr:O-acetylhomoserine aminocarboxypropyltransferase [Azospirillum thiophilum]ALG69786.1 O-acetylhomoserine aminocarboxypropyltransferase [Azospirillum thiophilum]KJR66529.1 O-acetylhomoserine aminocarboxypropyltransferase [Azospirillum thiophilum]
MAGAKFLKFDTQSLHAGQKPDPATGARAVPIHLTSSYVFSDVDQAAALFNLERPGHIYSRISNPTVAVLEERLATLEGGVGAVCTASGQAALSLAIMTLMGAGGHIVASSSIYGGSRNLLAYTLPRFGITTSFVHPRDLDGIRAAIRPETRLVFGEVLGNPGLEVLDVPKVAAIAHEAGIPLLIDSTFTTPYLCRPFEHGADLIMHSCTKWLGGHGTAIGGVVIDGGRFDWEASGKFPTLTEPYAGYHGIDFAEEYGPAAFIARARAEGLRDFGACMSPMNAFQILQGVETLPLRMKGHIHNARKIVGFLEGELYSETGAGNGGGKGGSTGAVAWVSYPELVDHPDHALAARLLPQGAGSIISFGIRGTGEGGSREAGRRFIESLTLFSHLANVGDAKSLVIHPASTTHAQLDAEALAAAGVGEDMIRLSIGLEDCEDLIDDLKQALRAATKG